MSAEARLAAVRLVLALLDDEDEQAWGDALDSADHTAIFWALPALVRTVGLAGFDGDADKLRWFLRTLEGSCATTVEFGPPEEAA